MVHGAADDVSTLVLQKVRRLKVSFHFGSQGMVSYQMCETSRMLLSARATAPSPPRRPSKFAFGTCVHNITVPTDPALVTGVDSVDRELYEVRPFT